MNRIKVQKKTYKKSKQKPGHHLLGLTEGYQKYMDYQKPLYFMNLGTHYLRICCTQKAIISTKILSPLLETINLAHLKKKKKEKRQ